jgi:hypothetical protein
MKTALRLNKMLAEVTKHLLFVENAQNGGIT